MNNLMENVTYGKQKSPFMYLVVFILITIFDLVLVLFGVVAIPIGPGVSGLYLAVAFMIAFTLWFGARGVIAAYIGTFIGAGMQAGIPLDINLYRSLGDVWQVLIPLLAFKMFNADIGLRTRKDFLIFIVFGWLLNNLAGAIWGTSTLAIGGIISWNDIPRIFTGWFISNLVVTIVITPLLLRYITPYIDNM